MARDRTSISKLSRREGVQLTTQRKVNKAIENRNFPPGPEGRRSRPSGYGTQLREKQKVKRIYSVLEKQFKNYFSKAVRQKGITGTRLLELLETRLDNVVYRAGWALTRRQARQFVNHGHVLVNGDKTDIPSYQVLPGDEVTISAHGLKSKGMGAVVALGNKPADWLLIQKGQPGNLKVTRLPAREEIDAFIREQLIVEFYSR